MPRNSASGAIAGPADSAVALTASAAGFDFAFRLLDERDLPLLHRWLNAPHVVAGYTRVPMSLDEVARKYRPRIAGDDPVRGHVVALDGNPIGYVQTYRPGEAADGPAPGDADDALAMDLLIGEVEYTQRGLGPRVIAAALDSLVWTTPGIARCLAGVRPDHSASVRAFRKAGFVPLHTLAVDDGASELVMELRRP